MANHSSILAWETSRTEDLEGCSPLSRKRVRHGLAALSWVLGLRCCGLVLLPLCSISEVRNQGNYGIWGRQEI